MKRRGRHFAFPIYCLQKVGINQFDENILLYINSADGAKFLAAVTLDAVTSVDNSNLFAALFLYFNSVTGA